MCTRTRITTIYVYVRTRQRVRTFMFVHVRRITDDKYFANNSAPANNNLKKKMHRHITVKWRLSMYIYYYSNVHGTRAQLPLLRSGVRVLYARP